VTPCGSIHATFLDLNLSSAEDTYTGGWAFVTFEYKSTAVGYQFYTDGVVVKLNG
jgi:hypothetical protein